MSITDSNQCYRDASGRWRVWPHDAPPSSTPRFATEAEAAEIEAAVNADVGDGNPAPLTELAAHVPACAERGFDR